MAEVERCLFSPQVRDDLAARCCRDLVESSCDSTSSASTTTEIQLVGVPTAIFEIGRPRLLVDPTFDLPGNHVTGKGRVDKTAGSAVPIDSFGQMDVSCRLTTSILTISTTRAADYSSEFRWCSAPQRRRRSSPPGASVA